MNRARTVTDHLRFVNRTAGGTRNMRVDPASVDMVIAMHGAFYSGDQYEVYLNGRRLMVDKNGERQYPTLHGRVVQDDDDAWLK